MSYKAKIYIKTYLKCNKLLEKIRAGPLGSDADVESENAP